MALVRMHVYEAALITGAAPTNDIKLSTMFLLDLFGLRRAA